MIPPEAIFNDEGQVAMRFMKQGQVYVRNPQTGNEYIFAMRANIGMAFVNEEDTDYMETVTTGCCGGKKKKAVYYADETHVRRWENGGGR